ncbi:MAG: AAA family ATPase [Candidatus Margulisiibacteriota bacterium]
MFLKNLTIKGFKTFAEKTSLDFDPSSAITGIVGPNGCGKSNVIDAVRFVIGEQSIKEMRGESLDQLIFAGTSLKKALSMAEVSITIDNADGKMKTDFSEVFIKRRIFRSGESEFFLNKNPCRLKDIKELFLDTGIGGGAYSIINQGQVDSILLSKPEDRRQLFEEAAGIGKYKFRKRASERRLIATEQNLLRVNDLRGEIKDAIATLASQAEKAREYTALKEELKNIEIGLSKRVLKSLKERKDNCLARIDELESKSSGAMSDVEKDEKERVRLKDRIRAIEASTDETRQESSKLREKIESAKSTVAINRERSLQLKERISALKNEAASIEDGISQRKPRLEEKEASLAGLTEGFGASKRVLEEAEKNFASISSKIEESIGFWNSLKNPVVEKEMELSSKKHRISELELEIKFARQSLEQDTSFAENLSGLKSDIEFIEKELLLVPSVEQSLIGRISERKLEINKKIEIELSILKESIDKKAARVRELESAAAEEGIKLEEIRSGASKAAEKCSEMEQKTKELTLQKEKAILELAEIRAGFKNYEQTYASKKEEIENLRTELSYLVRQAEEKNASTLDLSSRLESCEKEALELEASLPSLKEDEERLAASLQELVKEKGSLNGLLEELEAKMRSVSGEDRALRDNLSREQVTLAKIEGEWQTTEALLREEYGLTVEEVEKSDLESPSNMGKAKEETEGLKARIRALGAVNLLAIEEYEASKDRLSFIESQYADLVSARDNLNTLIRQLDKEARESFLANLESVSAHFTEIFSSLFEGGEAKITLLEGDPLEAGIEIMAKPSGKKWLSLSLMSGGEKALTAIALLFALMKTRPSPFCFMDEVDAALDEINVLRFTRMLRDFSRHSQIIVITHSKRTMSAADTLYGVTMEEPGISKVVSMKLVKVAD